MAGDFIRDLLNSLLIEAVKCGLQRAIPKGIWALGFLMVTVFYKIALSVREEVAAS